MTIEGHEPAWRQRAVERSLRSAKERAGQRVEKFIEAAQAIIVERATIEFTVQEVVERSGQSLRSFYAQFDGKHELLLALYEESIVRATSQIRAATENADDVIGRVRIAVELLHSLSQPDATATRPLFAEFAPTLLVSHPAELRVAHASLHTLLVDLLDAAAQAGDLRQLGSTARTAGLLLSTVMFAAQPAAAGSADSSISGDEVWEFCSHGIMR